MWHFLKTCMVIQLQKLFNTTARNTVTWGVSKADAFFFLINIIDKFRLEYKDILESSSSQLKQCVKIIICGKPFEMCQEKKVICILAGKVSRIEFLQRVSQLFNSLKKSPPPIVIFFQASQNPFMLTSTFTYKYTQGCFLSLLCK